MFTRPSLIKTQIKRNKQGKRSLMRTLGIFELHSLVDKTYNEFCNGKSIDKIFQEHAVAKKHKEDYIKLILDKFLRQENIVVDVENQQQLKMLIRFSSLTSKNKDIDLGFVYFIKNNNKFKIGRTNDLIKRLNNYKSHIGDYPKVIKVVFVAKHTNFEKNLIDTLIKLGYTTEWFDYTHYEVMLSQFDQ
jgi:hypothetical protein